jgi:glyoxylate reductase
MAEPAIEKPRVVLTRKLPDEIETRMMELFDVQLNADDQPMDHDTLRAAASQADVLVPTVTDKITPAVISAGSPKLKMIANYGAGVDHIDLAAARERQITITNTPDVLTADTADMTMALILVDVF